MREDQNIYLGSGPLKIEKKKVQGRYVRLEGETFYKISRFDGMDPFFMSLVSDSDHWMYIWSTGALTAGRKNPDHALFPYYTDDKILDYTGLTGSKTILFVNRDAKKYLWEPFSPNGEGLYRLERNCYKNICGNKLIFEEINHDLETAFRYAWLNSERFGFIKKSFLRNTGQEKITVDILDGIVNLLPSGIEQNFQLQFSTLVDAYKKNELLTDTGMGIFSLSSIPVDRAEPSEALAATTVFSAGVQRNCVLLSTRQLNAFRSGETLRQENETRALRGAYLVNSLFDLDADEIKTWYLVADVDKDSASVHSLNHYLRNGRGIVGHLEEEIDKGTQNLQRLVGSADGLQTTKDRLSTSRHFSNVLFNVMRGGLFEDGYRIDTGDFRQYIRTANKPAFGRHRTFLRNLPPFMTRAELSRECSESGDLVLVKLCYGYLPLSFSRRHGDPSRPWNRFSIEVRGEHGEKVLNYQGNWRDIFQNWEALAYSFPDFIEHMISKFVNASTADGYNPYRVTRDGFNWEILDPSDPWSYIGYWGDHQIIYLLKLMELSESFHPGRLRSFLTREIFTYANVPYRIKPYAAIVKDPFNTVDFDTELEKEIGKRLEQYGTDGRCVLTGDGRLYLVNLTEKLLVPVLAKLTHFIPGAGIWMNTQRPEWNDANNALVGNGVSMVTLYYLRRHLNFLGELLQGVVTETIVLSAEVVAYFHDISRTLNENRHLLRGSVTDGDRMRLAGLLGTAGSGYRMGIYKHGFSGKKENVSVAEITGLLTAALEYMDHSIRLNKDHDGLYHAYNLLEQDTKQGMGITRLYPMLEGQVAALSSGLLSPEEVVKTLTALRKSALYRDDQSTYILYPDRRLPSFIEKNTIPEEMVAGSELLQELRARGDRRIIRADEEGKLHFQPALRNAERLRRALTGLKDPDLKKLADRELGRILGIYESMFHHHSFTGRSGSFFKYEGLGSIYWHMVSKLLLAVQENFFRAVDDHAGEAIVAKLRKQYYEIRKGIGVNKSPDVYGGFPTDPYSHTPGHAGVQQPGMTGQVKEDIITRCGELGLRIIKGGIQICPWLLRREEFLDRKDHFVFFDVRGKREIIELDKNELAFTFCRVPFVYHFSDSEKITVTDSRGDVREIAGLRLDVETSTAIFNHSAEIKRIDVFLFTFSPFKVA